MNKLKKGVKIFLFLFLGSWFLYQVYDDISAMIRLKGKIRKEKLEITELEKRRMEYLKRIEFLKSDSAIKLLAKELGMVKK